MPQRLLNLIPGFTAARQRAEERRLQTEFLRQRLEEARRQGDPSRLQRVLALLGQTFTPTVPRRPERHRVGAEGEFVGEAPEGVVQSRLTELADLFGQALTPAEEAGVRRGLAGPRLPPGLGEGAAGMIGSPTGPPQRRGLAGALFDPSTPPEALQDLLELGPTVEGLDRDEAARRRFQAAIRQGRPVEEAFLELLSESPEVEKTIGPGMGRLLGFRKEAREERTEQRRMQEQEEAKALLESEAIKAEQRGDPDLAFALRTAGLNTKTAAQAFVRLLTAREAERGRGTRQQVSVEAQERLERQRQTGRREILQLRAELAEQGLDPVERRNRLNRLIQLRGQIDLSIRASQRRLDQAFGSRRQAIEDELAELEAQRETIDELLRDQELLPPPPTAPKPAGPRRPARQNRISRQEAIQRAERMAREEYGRSFTQIGPDQRRTILDEINRQFSIED